MHTVLPFHPRTGLQALGFTRRGPIWPVKGAEDPPADPPADPKPADPPADPPKDPAQDSPKDLTDWKAEARKWEERAKSNKDAATKLAEIEAANQTEAEKEKARADAAEAKVNESNLRIVRSEIKSAADGFRVRDDAILHLAARGDLSRFLDKDGDVDMKAVEKELADVLKDREDLAKLAEPDPKDPQRRRPVSELRPPGAPTDPPRSKSLGEAVAAAYQT